MRPAAIPSGERCTMTQPIKARASAVVSIGKSRFLSVSNFTDPELGRCEQ
jgi:hypothetical protein